jgi:hypothetical protein
MLITQPHQLGDQALDPEEALIRLKEENDAMLSNRRLHRQGELSDPSRSAGPRLSWNELIYRLSKCNPALLFKDGSSGNIAVYAPRSRRERDEHEYDPSKPDWYNDHKYVGGFAKDWLPEYSHIITNERKLPTREYRGWRSILLTLLKAKAITLESADHYFGHATGQRAWSWNQQLKEIRHNG